VAFHVDISDHELAYLDNLPLSPEAKERVNQFIEQFIANVPDEFRLDPENRPDPDKDCFLVRHIVLDRKGDGLIHTIEFYIGDAPAESGVLIVAYIDHHP
jgi:hypothetical protein